jgi:hypothetical protein
MSNPIYDHLEPEAALELEQIARLSYEAREHRRTVLEAVGASDEPALLERIMAGSIDEHPAYEHYLAARILDDTRQAARELIAASLKEIRHRSEEEPAPVNLHAAILEHVDREHVDVLARPSQLTQDALTIALRNGALLTVRYAAPDAYSLRWRAGPAPDAH